MPSLIDHSHLSLQSDTRRPRVDQAPLAEAVAEIGHGAVGVRGDVTRSADVARLYEQIQRDHQRVDGVFANAGIYAVVPLDALDDSHFDSIFDVNVEGMAFTVQEALPLMTAGSAVVLNGSIAGSKGLPSQSPSTPARQRCARLPEAGRMT